MTKSELIEAVAERTPHISKKDTEIVVNTIFDSMAQALKTGERIEIRGFGSFQVKVREARDGRNPKTGEPVHISAKRTPFFKVGKELREMVDSIEGPLPDSNGESDTVPAHELLGEGLLALHAQPTLHPSVPALVGNPKSLRVTFEDADVELLTKLMHGSEGHYRLSAAFQVSPVLVAGGEPPTPAIP